MLYIHQGNQQEMLVDAMIAHLQQHPPASPLAPIDVVLPDSLLADWLSERISARTGICANMHFQLPAAFIWSMMRRCLPDLPEESGFAPDILTWRLYAILRERDGATRDPVLSAYLDQASDAETWELASQLAYLFDRYLVYRPDWIASWEAGEANHWQGRLWQELAEGEGIHWVSQQKALLSALASTDVQRRLPSSIYLFAVYSLSPGYLNLVNALAQYTDVHLFVLNPSDQYWGLIRTRRQIVRKEIQGQETEYEESGNPLLASMGSITQQFMEALLDYDAELAEYFTAPVADSLLGQVQHDIFALQPTIALPAAIEKDTSLQLHSCHSALREVEVLHDLILDHVNHTADTGWHEIIVACPDLAVYEPFIRAVFDRARPAVPYSIASSATGPAERILQSMSELLETLTGRFEYSALFSLLEHEVIRSRFDISADDLRLLKTWFRHADVRWGIDTTHKQMLGLPETGRNTWRQGLTDLLMGNMISADHSEMVEDFFPLQAVEGLQSITLGRFIAFYDNLLHFRQSSRQERDAHGWQQWLWSLFSTFYEQQSQADCIRPLRTLIEQWQGHLQQSAVSSRFGLEVLQVSIGRYLSMNSGASSFQRSGIRFMSISSAAFQPARLMCMLGMNLDMFPRQDRHTDLNLMQSEYRTGDYSQRQEDRYLFLLCLLQARERLVMTCTGHNIRDNSSVPSSLLVEEVLESVTRVPGCSVESLPASVRVEHALQPFDWRYFQPESCPQYPSYSEDMFKVAQTRSSMRADRKIQLSVSAKETGSHIALADFMAFFAHSSRFYLQHILGARVPIVEGLEEDHENFVLDGLARWELRAGLASELAGQLDVQHISHQALTRNLPHGVAGDVCLQRESSAVELLQNSYQRWVSDAAEVEQSVELVIGQRKLTGQLLFRDSEQQVVMLYGKIRARHELMAWLKHLLYCALHPEQENAVMTVIGLDAVVSYRYVPQAQDELAELLSLYLRACQAPVPLFPEAGMACVRKDLAAAEKKWLGDEWAERHDAAHALLWHGYELDEQFEQISASVFQSLVDYRKVLEE